TDDNIKLSYVQRRIKMPKISIISDFRESFPTKDTNGKTIFNDHPRKQSIEAVCDSLKNKGYDCSIFGGVPELTAAFANNEPIDKNAIYVNMSDGMTQPYSRVQIPILCDMLGIKYSGSGPFEVALMTNKHYTKLAVQEKGILCPQGMLITENYNHNKINGMNFPVMIKPNTEGSSVGITQQNVCFSAEEACECLDKLLKDFSELVVEEYIKGADATCFLLGNQDKYVVDEVLLVKHHEKLFFDKEVIEMADHAEKRTQYIMAKDALSESVIEEIKGISKNAARTLHVRDIVRFDYRVTAENCIFFLEANTVPRVSDTSELGFICNYYKWNYSDILAQYIDSIIARINRD
ncbi:D-ala D-alanine ligase, partial [human gut metagenome]